jgi:hypothetical protein
MLLSVHVAKIPTHQAYRTLLVARISAEMGGKKRRTKRGAISTPRRDDVADEGDEVGNEEGNEEGTKEGNAEGNEYEVQIELSNFVFELDSDQGQCVLKTDYAAKFQCTGAVLDVLSEAIPPMTQAPTGGSSSGSLSLDESLPNDEDFSLSHLPERYQQITKALQRASNTLSSVMSAAERTPLSGEGDAKTQDEELSPAQDERLIHLSRMAYHAVEICLERLTASESNLRQGTERRQLDKINTALSSYVVSDNNNGNGDDETPVARLLSQFRVARAQQLYHTKAALDRSDLSHSAQLLGSLLCPAVDRFSGYDTSQLIDACRQRSTKWNASADQCHKEADSYRERMMDIRDQLARDHSTVATKQAYEDIRKQSLRDLINHFAEMPEAETVSRGASASAGKVSASSAKRGKRNKGKRKPKSQPEAPEFDTLEKSTDPGQSSASSSGQKLTDWVPTPNTDDTEESGTQGRWTTVTRLRPSVRQQAEGHGERHTVIGQKHNHKPQASTSAAELQENAGSAADKGAHAETNDAHSPFDSDGESLTHPSAYLKGGLTFAQAVTGEEPLPPPPQPSNLGSSEPLNFEGEVADKADIGSQESEDGSSDKVDDPADNDTDTSSKSSSSRDMNVSDNDDDSAERSLDDTESWDDTEWWTDEVCVLPHRPGDAAP